MRISIVSWPVSERSASSKSCKWRYLLTFTLLGSGEQITGELRAEISTYSLLLFRRGRVTTCHLWFRYAVSPNVFKRRFSVDVCFNRSFDLRLSVIYDRWLPLLNKILTVTDFDRSSFVAMAVAV